MKLVAAVVQDYDADPLLRAVADAGLRATRIASTGGFLRQGNTTILLGVADEQVGLCLALLRAMCGARVVRPSRAAAGMSDVEPAELADVELGGAVAFVARVERHEQFAGGAAGADTAQR